MLDESPNLIVIRFVKWVHRHVLLLCSFVVVGGREVMSSFFINNFNLSSTKGQYLNSFSTCWQYAHVYAISTLGCGVVIDIFHWIGGHSTIPEIGIFYETP